MPISKKRGLFGGSEAAKSQRRAGLALGIAVFALLVWLVTGVLGYLADRSDARAGDVANARMDEHMAEQNRLLKATLVQQAEAERQHRRSREDASAAATAVPSSANRLPQPSRRPG